MNTRHSRLAVAALCAVGIFCTVVCTTHAESLEEKVQRLERLVEQQNQRIETQDQRLQAQDVQLQQVRAEQNATWMSEQQAEQVRSLIHDVLADAQTRQSFVYDDGSVGYDPDRGFYLRSPDNAWRLSASFGVQIGYTYRDADFEGPTPPAPGPGPMPMPDSDDGDDYGFQVDRSELRLGVDYGDFLDARLVTGTYAFNSGLFLKEAYAGFNLSDAFRIEAGRFRSDFGREESISAFRQNAAERSVTNEVFNAGRVEGLRLQYTIGEEPGFDGDSESWSGPFSTSPRIKLSAALTDGFRSGEDQDDGTEVFIGQKHFDGFGFTGGPSISSDPDLSFKGDDRADWGITGRVDAQFAGNDENLIDAGSWSPGLGTVFGIGGGVHYEEAEDSDFLSWTVDSIFKYRGFGLLTAGYGLHWSGDEDFAEDYDLYGFSIQPSYLITDNIQVFAGFDWILQEDIANESNELPDDVFVWTIGANYYIDGYNTNHNNKVTVDFVYTDDAIPYNVMRTGLQSKTSGDDDAEQFLIRAQYQLNF